jgi:4-hydroxy-3-methylbut-2-enyl diphosphate reductase
MKVKPILPFGYCKGVQQAILLAKKAKEENPDRACYLLGMLVHNEETIADLKNHGLIVLDDSKDSLESLLLTIPDGQVVIFSAHGHDKKLDEIAKNKSLTVYDSTCSFVSDNLKEAFEASKRGSVIYIGAKGHLEAESFLANFKEAVFYDVKSDLWDPSSVKGSSPTVISQTTLSYLELEKAHKAILSAFPDAKIGPERCLATTLRQEAIANIPESIQTVIVLGSARSNNSKKLYEIAKEHGKEAYLCLGLDDVKKLSLKASEEIALATGASTSPKTYHDVLEYLESL